MSASKESPKCGVILQNTENDRHREEMEIPIGEKAELADFLSCDFLILYLVFNSLFSIP
jgi:hypothetical protein